jgi:hypothetical protein
MIGELTPWYTRQKEYADSQLTQQQAALGAMKLDSIMKAQKDFEQMSAEDKLKQAATPTPIPTDKAKVAPTAVPTSSTEATPTTRSADGTPMPSFNTGTTSAEPASTAMPSFMSTAKPEEAAKPAAEAKAPVAEEKKTPILQAMKNENQAYTDSQQRVDFMYRFADKLRNNGNLLAYQDAIKVADNAKTAMYDQQIKHLAVQDKFLDMSAGMAYGYKKAVAANPLDQASSDKAWAALLLDLNSQGIPIDMLQGITDPKERSERVEQYINKALNGKEQISLATQEANLKIKEERNRITDRHYQNQDNINLQKQIFNQAKFSEKAANDLLKDSESDLKSLRMSLNTAMSKPDRDNFRTLLSEAQTKHDQLVKDLKEKAKTDGIKWTPVITSTTNQEAAPTATTDNTAAAPTNQAAPVESKKPKDINFLPEATAKSYAKDRYDPNYNYWITPDNRLVGEKKTATADSTSNTTNNVEPKKTDEEIKNEKKLKRITEIEKKLNATPLKLTGSKGLGIYGQLMQGASTLGVAERKELEIELKRLKSEVQ